MAKKIRPIDALDSEMADRADELGYSFLGELGYDTTNAKTSATTRAKINKKLKENNQVLIYRLLINEKGEMLLYYHIVVAGTENSKHPKILHTSQGLKFIPKKSEVKNV